MDLYKVIKSLQVLNIEESDCCLFEIIPLNLKEFAILSDTSIQKYNVNKNKWSEWIKSHFQWSEGGFSFGIDEKNEQLFVLANSILSQININSNKVSTIDVDLGVDENGDEHTHGVGFFLNNEFNIIIDGIEYAMDPDGNVPAKHCVWSTTNNTFQMKKEVHVRGFSCVFHLKSKKNALLLDMPDTIQSLYAPPKITIYSLKQREWKLVKEIEYIDESISNHDQYEIQLGQSCALSIDEQYILFSGRIYDCHKGDEEPLFYVTDKQYFHILNLETMKMQKTKIVFPTSKSCVFICLNADQEELELITFAFIGNVWRSKEFSNTKYPSTSVIRLVALFLLVQYVHVVEEYEFSGSHWKIRLDNITTSLAVN